jgi:hypothetical protein
MPNWTKNKIIVTGDKVDVKKIYDAKFSFHALHPCPFHDGRQYVDGWYGWTSANWGTKWDVIGDDGELDQGWGEQTIEYDENVYEGLGWLQAELLTPNDPPVKLLRYISEQMPSLEITLYYWIDDGSDDYCGEFEFTKGTSVYDKPDDDVVFIRRHFYCEYMMSDDEDSSDDEDNSDEEDDACDNEAN